MYQAAQVWQRLTDYRYVITYGYKKKLYAINLTFSSEDFPHLAGFQYLKDLSLPKYNPQKIITQILNKKIRYEKIVKGNYYESMVKPRLEAMICMEEILNTDFFLFSYMPQMYPFKTTIKAEYLISSRTEIVKYVFIIQDTSKGVAKCDYLCCSAFVQGERNYELNQRSRTILKKERIQISTNTSTILMDKFSSQNPR